MEKVEGGGGVGLKGVKVSKLVIHSSPCGFSHDLE